MSIALHIADVHEPYWSMQALLDMSLYAMDSFGALQYGSWTVPAVAAVSSMKRKSAPCSGVCGGELYCLFACSVAKSFNVSLECTAARADPRWGPGRAVWPSGCEGMRCHGAKGNGGMDEWEEGREVEGGMVGGGWKG